MDVNICYYALCHVPELTSKANNIVILGIVVDDFKKINQDLKQRGRRITVTWAKTSSRKEAFNMSSQVSDPIKVYMTGNLSLINNCELWKYISQKTSWVLEFQKLLFPRQKCSRDWERVKDQRKADDVMWRQLVYSAFASDSGHCFVLCGIKQCNWL